MEKKDYSYYFNKYEKFLTNIIDKKYNFIKDKETLKECMNYSFTEFINKYSSADEDTIHNYIINYYYSFFLREILNSIDIFNSYEDRVSISLMAILRIEDRIIEPVTMEKIAKYYGIDRNTRYSILGYIKNYLDLEYNQDAIKREREEDIEDLIIERIYMKSFKNKLKKEFNKLKDDRKDVIVKRLGLDGNKEQKFVSIAKDYNCTTYNVQLKYERAIKKLEKKLGNSVEKELL